MKAYLQQMFRFTAWADRRTLESLRNQSAAHAEALPLLAHLLAAEHVWLSRLERREPRLAVWPTLSMEECESLASENASGYLSYLENLDDAKLATSIRYRTSQGHEFENTALDILSQVITHGPYHRGQIAKTIGRSGGTAVNTDLIMFVREQAVD